MRRFAFTHSRLVLVWACLGVQAVALAGSGIFAFWTIRRVISRAVEQRVIDANTQVADRYADLIEGLGVTDLDPDGPGWERIQAVIASADLPGGAFLCVADAQGNVVCHPEIRDDHSLLGLPLGRRVLKNASDGSSGPLAEADPSATVTGRLGFLGDTHYVATRALSGMNARLIVLQPESGLVSLSAIQMTELIGETVLAGLIVMAATGLTIWWMSGRHDRRLDRFHTGLGEEIEARLIHSLASRHALIFGLAKLADCRDTETGAHLERICAYSFLLAEKLRDRFDEIDDAWLESMRVAPCLHDIGKVGIPDAILLKPGPLTQDERRLMQKHPDIGADTLSAILERVGGDDPVLAMGVRIAIEHHERWDGSGYPRGLKGDQTALSARIVALADVYDALTSKRVYKDAMNHKEAVQIIRQGRGRHFDPVVVDAFESIRDEFEQIRRETHQSEAGELSNAHDERIRTARAA